ncbi:hypothetical protein D3C71_1601230 [compost metagenome]
MKLCLWNNTGNNLDINVLIRGDVFVFVYIRVCDFVVYKNWISVAPVGDNTPVSGPGNSGWRHRNRFLYCIYTTIGCRYRNALPDKLNFIVHFRPFVNDNRHIDVLILVSFCQLVWIITTLPLNRHQSKVRVNRAWIVRVNNATRFPQVYIDFHRQWS